MIKITTLGALSFCVFLVTFGAGLAHMPHVPARDAAPADNLVIEVRNCHANGQYHYVPEWGYQTRHYHRGSRCRPVPADARDDDIHCHENRARHSHSGYGRTTHYHYGRRCRIEVLDGGGFGGGGSGACIQIGNTGLCINQ